MAVSRVEIAVAAGARPRAGTWTTLARFARKKPLGAAGGVLILAMLVTAIFAEVLQTHDPIATDASAPLAAPSADHWLGTDHLGRDIYSRIVHGARVSLIVGVASTLLGSVLGGIIGLLSGYAGGNTDLITQRILDILQGLPLLVLPLVVGAGVSEPCPCGGGMLVAAAGGDAQKARDVVLFPGMAISLAVFGSNLPGDALRDTLDRRLRGS